MALALQGEAKVRARALAPGRRGLLKAAGGLFVATVSACASIPPPEPPDSAPARRSQVPPATPFSYVLAPGDDLEISFFRTPELNQHQLVRPDGGISLAGAANPRAREVQAADLTVGELRDALIRIYGSELKDPDITVTVRAFGSNTVFVTGEVGRPGAIPLSGDMTALQAILAAEGFKSTARPKEVLLIRRLGRGRAAWQLLDLSKALGAANFTDDLLLAPHDIVYVPRSHIGNIDEFVDLYLRRTLPIQPGIQVPVS